MKTAIELAAETKSTRQNIYGHAARAGVKPDRFGRYTEADARKILSRIGNKPGPKTGSRRKKAA